ncbi:T9SS type A sorting domain-containing protein [Flavobacterium artemisiae]|uniref:T9SS type A sorting domain-containing protein n=1 Tax=Flavobacterium artemisiae TaxID=2126556 RepID=A0ABW4HDC1_9FLAO
MKTKLLLLLLLANFSIYSQINYALNEDFENWNNNDLVNWTTLNSVSSSTDASTGNYSAKLSLTNSSLRPQIATKVSLKAGVIYTIKFKYKYLNNNYSGLHPISLKISQTGSSTTLSSNTFATNNLWTEKETIFIPDTNISYDLSFSTFSFDDESFDVLIDDVKVISEVPLQYTSIPDINFEKKLIALGIDSGAVDGKVLTSNIESIKTIDLYFSNIIDLTGIEDFKALESLSCMSNKISAIDLSKNTALTYLNIAYNNLSTLDLSSNLSLENLSVSNNNLTFIDVSQNINLRYFSCATNQLTSIDVKNNKLLNMLWCQFNLLTNLDLSKNSALESFLCSNNKFLTTVNLKNGNNGHIYASPNSVNFTENPLLKCIIVDNALYANEKWSLFKDLTASYSTADCSLLTAIPDPTFEDKLIALQIDKDGKNGSVLNSSIENITSLNVSSASIKDLTGIEGFTNLNSLNCSGNLLTSLNLKKNIALTFIDCSNNILIENLSIKNGYNENLSLTSNFTSNPNLKCIEVDNASYSNSNWNSLKDETASYNEDCDLYTLIPDSNFEDKLIALEIDKDGKNGKIANSSIKKVTSLDLSNSNINNLAGIEAFTALTYLDCNYNNLQSIDVSKNTLLTKLALHDNKLTSLDISANKELFNLMFSQNQISTIDLSQNKKLHYLTADRNNLTSIDFSANSELESIYCGSNNLTTLNVSNLPNLLDINCTFTSISKLDVSSNPKLVNLYFNNCLLTELDLSNNPLLKRINVSNNLLTSLDLSHNHFLELIFIEFNPITTLNIKNGNNENFILPTTNKTSKTTAAFDACSFLSNKNLSCIQVDNVEFSNLNWSQIKDATATYSSTCKSLTIEESIFNKVVIHPNPTKDELNIQNVSLEKANVYNVLGQLVKSFNLNSNNTDNTINLSGLPKGVYYIYLINGDTASAKKVIVE